MENKKWTKEEPIKHIQVNTESTYKKVKLHKQREIK